MNVSCTETYCLKENKINDHRFDILDGLRRWVLQNLRTGNHAARSLVRNPEFGLEPLFQVVLRSPAWNQLHYETW